MNINEIVTKLENDLRKKADNFFYEPSFHNLLNRLCVISLGIGPHSQELAESISQTTEFLIDARRICDRIILEKSKAAKLEAERKQHDYLETDA